MSHKETLTNLLALQNKIKRDPQGHYEDFAQANVHFKSCLDLFELEPAMPHKQLQQLIMFIAYITPCYMDDLKDLPTTFRTMLVRHKTTMHPHLRMAFCKALVFYRNRKIVTPPFVTEIFFELCSCQDKILRQFIRKFIKADIKNINKKQPDVSVNKALQEIIFGKLKVSNPTVVKVALSVLMDMFRKRIWRDAKVVNNIATCLFTHHPGVLVKALSFFVKRNEEGEIEQVDSDSDASDAETKREKKQKEMDALLAANKVSKKTKQKKKRLERAQKVLKKEENEEAAVTHNSHAFDMVYDPQSLTEKLFRVLSKYTGKFHIKLMMMDLVSRLIGLNRLLILNFYAFMQKFLHAHQRDVPKCLLFLAQAVHDELPDDVVEKIIKTICYNFISDHNGDEVMMVGLNAVREILLRHPHALDNNLDLVEDLAGYKMHRNRGVVAGARSIIHLLREVNPTVLKKKYVGRPTQYMKEVLNNPDVVIPGADVLVGQSKDAQGTSQGGTGKHAEEASDDEDQWEDVESGEDDSDEEDGDEDGEMSVGEEESEAEASEDDEAEMEEESDEEEEEEEEPEEQFESVKDMLKARILTEEDYRKIKIEKMRKKMTAARPVEKRKLKQMGASATEKKKMRLAEERKVVRDEKIAKMEKTAEDNLDPDEESESSEEEADPTALPSYESIARIQIKKRKDKEAKMASILAGREDREKYGHREKRRNPDASTTHKEKSRAKNFMMMRQKKKRTRMSFVERQTKLKASLKRRYAK